METTISTPAETAAETTPPRLPRRPFLEKYLPEDPPWSRCEALLYYLRPHVLSISEALAEPLTEEMPVMGLSAAKDRLAELEKAATERRLARARREDQVMQEALRKLWLGAIQDPTKIAELREIVFGKVDPEDVALMTASDFQEGLSFLFERSSLPFVSVAYTALGMASPTT